MEDAPLAEVDEQVLASRFDTLNATAAEVARRVRTPRQLERVDDVSFERLLERCGDAMNGVAFGHATCVARRAPSRCRPARPAPLC